jgi:hypothetical protein
MTFLAALRRDRSDAPWVLDGPINGEAFKTYLYKFLFDLTGGGNWLVDVHASS